MKNKSLISPLLSSYMFMKINCTKFIIVCMYYIERIKNLAWVSLQNN